MKGNVSVRLRSIFSFRIHYEDKDEDMICKETFRSLKDLENKLTYIVFTAVCNLASAK